MQSTAQPAGLVHTAAFYRGDAEYLTEVLPFVMDGLAQGDPVLVAVPADKLTLLRDALGEAAERVEMTDMGDLGRNPANTFAMFAAALAAEHNHRRMWAIAEPVWPGRSPDEYPACVQNEALYNTAFADSNLITLCPYDAAGLPEDVLADARRTHPLIRRHGQDVVCPDFGWQQAFQDFNTPLAADPQAAIYHVEHLDDLSAARAFAAQVGQSAGLSLERLGDLHLIVTELATNSLKYTGEGCRLGLWKRDGKLICEVRDGGRLDDPLAGRRPPADKSTTGRGLLLVNSLAELVRMHTSDTGTTIQVYLPLTAEGETSIPLPCSGIHR